MHAHKPTTGRDKSAASATSYACICALFVAQVSTLPASLSLFLSLSLSVCLPVCLSLSCLCMSLRSSYFSAWLTHPQLILPKSYRQACCKTASCSLSRRDSSEHTREISLGQEQHPQAMRREVLDPRATICLGGLRGLSVWCFWGLVGCKENRHVGRLLTTSPLELRQQASKCA